MAEVNKIFQIAYVAKKRDGSRAVDKKARTVEGWASRPIIDRDNELIEWDAWQLDNFDNNPVLMAFHDYSRNPIGTVQWTKATKEGLLFKAKFADKGTSVLADEMFDLYDQGIMNAFSVGFRPIEWVDAKGADEPNKRYTKAELLEISGVGLPSCTTALVAEYEAGNIKTRELRDQIYADAITKGMIVEPKEVAEDDAIASALQEEESEELKELAKDDETEEARILTIIRRELKQEDVEEKEGRRFSGTTLKTLDGMRTAAKASNEANQAVIEALDILVGLPEDDADEIGEEVEAKDIETDDLEEMTPEEAEVILDGIEKEKQAAANAKKLTPAEEVLVRLGRQL